MIDDIVKNVIIALAKESQRTLAQMSLSQREQIITNIRAMTHENAEKFAKMAVEETGMGNVEHKILKHQLVANKTPGTEDIKTRAMMPFGVIGAITPSTNPSETVICNTIGMLAGGNSVVFSPHPGAMKTSMEAVAMVNRAAGMAIAFKADTDMLLTHKDISLLVATGGPGLVASCLKSGKRAIGAGAGNPPVLVDDTADIHKAAEDIIIGCTFDNNLPCIAEKSIVAMSSIADKLMDSMKDCYQASKADIVKLEALVLTPNLNRKCVGKNADTLLEMAGIAAPKGIRCIIFEGQKEHPLIANELMMPILGMVRANSFDEAVETALWLEHGYGHSAHIHSKNIDRLTYYERTMNTTILVKNAPSYAALGFGTEGYCSFTIASRTGEGLTSASTFTKQKHSVIGGLM